MTVAVEDADGDVYQVDAGTLPADGRDHVLTAGLGPAAAATGSAAAVYPLRLVTVSLAYTLPATPARGPALFTVDGVSGGPGTPGGPARRWTAGRRRFLRRTGGRT